MEAHTLAGLRIRCGEPNHQAGPVQGRLPERPWPEHTADRLRDYWRERREEPELTANRVVDSIADSLHMHETAVRQQDTGDESIAVQVQWNQKTAHQEKGHSNPQEDGSNWGTHTQVQVTRDQIA
jgi:hypothetical protein